MRFSFVIFWTIVGAGIGLVLAPPTMGSSWMAERQAKLRLGVTIAGAAAGLAIGLVHDHFERRGRPK